MRIIISSIIYHFRWFQIFPDITLNLVNYLCLRLSMCRLLSTLWHIIRVAGYDILHRKKCVYKKLYEASSVTSDDTRYPKISRQQLVPFDYQHTVFVKFANIKRVARYLFCKGSNLTHFIVSSIICHVRWYQIFPEITLNFVSYFFDYQNTVYVKILGYKTSSWVFILHRKKWNAHIHIRHHLPRQIIQDISRYQA